MKSGARSRGVVEDFPLNREAHSRAIGWRKPAGGHAESHKDAGGAGCECWIAWTCIEHGAIERQPDLVGDAAAERWRRWTAFFQLPSLSLRYSSAQCLNVTAWAACNAA
jgi:hypothetical protein